MATVRTKSTSRTSKRPKLNMGGGDDSNLNDLVNFQLPPRRQHLTGPRRSRKTMTTVPWAKERFINSAYRFVLKPSVTADYTVHFVDPDIYFQWGDIVQILVPYTGTTLGEEGNSTCPVCLCPPVAPRMTKCGHVYCFACVLHYLQTSEHKGWHRCPICFDSISEASLKPVKWFYGAETESGPASPGSTLKMRLMRRPQITTLALPQSDTWPSDLIPPHQAAFQFLPDISTFAKFMIPTPQTLQTDFQHELDALQVDKDEKIGFGDGLEASFVEGAILKVRGLMEEMRALDVPSLRDAIATAMRGMEKIASQRALRDAAAKFADFSVSDHRPEEWAEEGEQALNEIRGAASSTPTKLKARKNVNPPPPSTSTYYFYQAASGSLTFLHPLDIRILLSHFGSYASFPETIEVKVEARNEGSVDEDLRKRCRYLAHLPEAADVTFIEADLEQVVGRDALSPFDSALRSRRARRKEKERKDDRAKARAEEKEKERMTEEHWVLKFSASRPPMSAQQEEEELRVFLQGASVDMEGRESASVGAQGQQNILPGVWGERSFASTLSGPSIARARQAPVGSREENGWDVDAAWKELEQARSILSGGEGGRKKKAPKLVLSLNGGGVPTGRRR
ncbi:hypothetical protein FRC17_005623 [Serendipita sp. 399]|nr:hypothetical protein FRC17_005623 [Serendipita sp. 399]